MADNRSRRDVLKLIGVVGATWAAAQLLAPNRAAPATLLDAGAAALLDDYYRSARANIVIKRGQRAMLSSPLYPKATFVRDAFYGPLAMDDLGLSAECYQWFVRTQHRGTGQIRTAVPFEVSDEAEFIPGDDDSSLLFVIWSAWLKRNRVPIDLAVVERAWAFVQSRVSDDQFVSPAGAFRYWADTVTFDGPERVAHNQGLYVLALRAMQQLGLGGIANQTVDAAKAHYQAFFDAGPGALRLGKDSWWADKLDLSALFPEFLLRWLYAESALPDSVVGSTVERFRTIGAVTDAQGRIAGLKIICAADGSFLDRERFYAPGLNWPGDYHNGGYWPMYTLTALALAFRLNRDEALRQLIGQLITRELAADHVSKEVIILSPGAVGSVDPERSQYTWNALIVPALKWAGLA